MHGECTTNPGTDVFERTGHMALLAKLPKTAVVHVVYIVAADAGAALRHFARHGLVVTCGTGNAFMSAVEHEGCLRVVVEAPCFPRQRVVAGLAAGAEREFVLVIFFVTGNASRVGVLEGGGHVALLAFDAYVLAEQRETSQAVIDLGGLPVAFVMAGLALPAFLALVLVVLFVAGDAGSLQLFLEKESGMAAVAPGLGVLAAQDELGVAIVIEFHVFPAFFQVTGLAFRAEATTVAFLFVVGFVTGDTGGFEPVLEQEARMATVALGPGMLAAQGEFGVAIVIEDRDTPVFLRMAGFALPAETSLVTFLLVVGLVAGHAGGLNLVLI